MTVYVDDMNYKYGRMIMCHLLADSEDELAAFVKTLGIDLKYWQYKGTRRSHFDICLAKKKKAISLGAVEVTIREMAYMRKNRNNPNEKLISSKNKP